MDMSKDARGIANRLRYPRRPPRLLPPYNRIACRRGECCCGRGGFGLVLGVTAVVAMGFLIAAIAIAIFANGVEKARLPQPAE